MPSAASPAAPMAAPDWLALDHVWLPHTQMAGAPLPLPVVAASGSRIELADGRTLVDGIASWWTACHGYNHPHIRAAVAAQLDRLPHVMFAGLAHEPAYTLAARLARLLPGGNERQLRHVSYSQALPVAYLHVFPFSPRPGTPAARLPRVPPGEVRRRAQVLRELGRQKRAEFYQDNVGRVAEVLVEGPARESGWLKGLSANYLRVLLPGPAAWRNRRVMVRFEGVSDEALIGLAVT